MNEPLSYPYKIFRFAKCPLKEQDRHTIYILFYIPENPPTAWGYLPRHLASSAILQRDGGISGPAGAQGSPGSTILRHDTKQNSYKIALVRAINDVALALLTSSTGGNDSSDGITVAVPLRVLAERWIAYYWPFVDTDQPILQGHRSRLGGIQRSDMSFRSAL